MTSLDGDEPLVRKRATGHDEDGRDYTIFCYSVPMVPCVMFESAAPTVTEIFATFVSFCQYY